MKRYYDIFRGCLIMIATFTIVATFFIGIWFPQYIKAATKNISINMPEEWIIQWHESQNQTEGNGNLTAPSINMPFLDMVITSNRPLLSINNAFGGIGEKTYTFQIDQVPTFDSKSLIEYKNIPESTNYITEKQIEPEDALTDNTRYYFRARAVDLNKNKGPWVITRFNLNTSYDKSFMNLTRVQIKNIEASSGPNAKNIIDWDYSSDDSFWAAAPPCQQPWIKFDLGKTTTVSRLWQLCDKSKLGGWLKDFVWQWSNDGKTWIDIPQTKIQNNDTYANLLDFKPISARYFRLLIKKWYGYAPRIFTIILYSPGMPAVPETPKGDYVLLIGNVSDGSTWTKLAKFIDNCGLGLKTLTVPCYEASLSMLNSLDKKPVAIILSGILGDRSSSMFEYGGEFEIIRKTDIPLLGICFGHQFLAMSQGMTFVRGMGYLDDTSVDILEGKTGTQIDIVDQYKGLAIFDGIPDPFIAAEIHIWSIAELSLPDDYEIIAKSDYVQMIKSKNRMVYGVQFHPEIAYDYNQGSDILVNFLKMALKTAKKK